MFSAKLDKLQIREKRYLSDPFNLYSLGPALLINIIHWWYLESKLGHSTGNVILHYNLITGPDLVDKAKFAFLLPATALLSLVINSIIAQRFYRKEKLAAYFLNFSSIALQLIFFVATLTIVYING